MNGHSRNPPRFRPGRHPNPGQLLFAALVGALSALLWGWITRIPMVYVMTLGFDMIGAWFTPEAKETKRNRIVNGLVSGAVAALAGVLGVRWHLIPGGR